MKNIFLGVLMLALSLGFMVPSHAVTVDFDFDMIKKAMEKTYRPFNSDFLFLEVNGEIYIASDNGRFLIRPKTGDIMDLWYRTKIESPADIKDVSRIYIDRLTMNIDTLNVYKYGKKDMPKVHIFIDAMGPSNRILFEKMEELKESYQFKLVVLPSSTKESIDVARKLACNEDGAASLSALLKQDFSRLEGTKNKSCQDKVFVQTSMFASMLKIKRMPTIVAPNGAVYEGMHRELRSIISGE